MLICEDWKKNYKEATRETDGEFGHNCDFGWGRPFGRLAKMVNFKLLDHYTCEVYTKDSTVPMEELLIFIITKFPGASSSSYSKKTGVLTLEWHF